MKHRLTSVLLVSVLVAAAPTVAARAEAPPQLPDLVALPTEYVEVGPPFHHDPRLGARTLKFPTVVANLGDYALDLVGTPSTTHAGSFDAQQCVHWASQFVCDTRAPAGRIRLHEPHLHWHVEEFAVYELRRLTEDSTPDFDPEGLLSTSGKISFCMFDSDRADGRPTTESPPIYQECTPAWQGISPGWADTYDIGLEGQELPIAHLDDGDYALVITLNPVARLHEADYSNNTTWSLIRLREGGTRVSVTQP